MDDRKLASDTVDGRLDQISTDTGVKTEFSHQLLYLFFSGTK
jgi:hypothetical protein